MQRDKEEIKTLDGALAIVKEEPYYKAIVMIFFKYMKKKDVAEAIPCDPSTLWRHVNPLLDRMCVYLYGADALKD